MALTDIISKIESDAASEAAEILAVAEQRAAEIRAASEKSAAEYRDSVMADATESADREASRIVVAAKLAARDRGLTARRALIDEALAATTARLAGLDADRYAQFLAARIARVARGGETVRFGAADKAAADKIVAAVAEMRPSLNLEVSAEPAPFDRGALIQGERVKADLSLAAIVDERRDELELILSDAVFGKEG